MRALLVWLCLSLPISAETVMAVRDIPAQSVLTASDLVLSPDHSPGALQDLRAALGLQTRRALYAGRAIHAADLGIAETIKRNARVALRYDHLGLSIETEGRALEAGGEGALIRVMNLRSKHVVFGVINEHGQVEVEFSP